MLKMFQLSKTASEIASSKTFSSSSVISLNMYLQRFFATKKQVTSEVAAAGKKAKTTKGVVAPAKSTPASKKASAVAPAPAKTSSKKGASAPTPAAAPAAVAPAKKSSDDEKAQKEKAKVQAQKEKEKAQAQKEKEKEKERAQAQAQKEKEKAQKEKEKEKEKEKKEKTKALELRRKNAALKAKARAKEQVEKSIAKNKESKLIKKQVKSLRPKRPLSAYISFSNAERKKLGKDVPFLDVGKIVSERWAKLSDKEKNKFAPSSASIDAYKKNFQVFLKKKQELVPKKKAGAYALFVKENFPKIKKKNPNQTFSKVISEVSKLWKTQKKKEIAH